MFHGLDCLGDAGQALRIWPPSARRDWRPGPRGCYGAGAAVRFSDRHFVDSRASRGCATPGIGLTGQQKFVQTLRAAERVERFQVQHRWLQFFHAMQLGVVFADQTRKLGMLLRHNSRDSNGLSRLRPALHGRHDSAIGRDPLGPCRHREPESRTARHCRSSVFGPAQDTAECAGRYRSRDDIFPVADAEQIIDLGQYCRQRIALPQHLNED